MTWEDEHFRTAYRMSKDTFWAIVEILKRNVIFESQGNKQQRPVHYQLAVFLLRYGVAGSHARHPMLLTSISEGTVTLYCRRVVRAIREHGLECVVWPTAERKEEIKRGFKKICGLDGIVGSLDGTLCGLESKPRTSGNSFISRKKTLSVNAQAIVDHNGQFIAFQTGWPGSRPDCAVWPHTSVYINQDRLFRPGEFLLADGGYTVSPIILTPFARNELGLDTRRRREFNKKISRARIVVEWAFGRLKSRFPALKKLGAVRDIRDTYRVILATMVLHNMCHQLGDAPGVSHAQLGEEIDGESDEEDDSEQTEPDYSNMTSLNAGRAFRL
ncbi:hypothetical protein FRC10_002108 [Ceratobasidium sp. 414]|nr:hypothetical protein FRC10_002108 [Ceratobasidium sp. 414]